MNKTPMPKINTRNYLSEEELVEYDALALGNVFGGQTAAGLQRMRELETAALRGFVANLSEKGYTTSVRDRVVRWFASLILRAASPEYQMLLWVVYTIGLDKSGLEEE